MIDHNHFSYNPMPLCPALSLPDPSAGHASACSTFPSILPTLASAFRSPGIGAIAP